MATLTAKSHEVAQRVRQFVVRSGLEGLSFPPYTDRFPTDLPRARRRLPQAFSVPGVELEETTSETSPVAAGLEYRDEDLPSSVRYRSLSRKLDDAYDDCYRSPVTEFFGGFLNGLFGK